VQFKTNQLTPEQEDEICTHPFVSNGLLYACGCVSQKFESTALNAWKAQMEDTFQAINYLPGVSDKFKEGEARFYNKQLQDNSDF